VADRAASLIGGCNGSSQRVCCSPR
jgi:hypothetical protein